MLEVMSDGEDARFVQAGEASTPHPQNRVNLVELGEELDGILCVPGSPGYEAVRRPANPAYRDVRPGLVIRCGSVADVALGLGTPETGIPIVPRGGGHCFAGRSSTDGIVLDLARLDRISVADGGLATIGAGARLAQVYAALHAALRQWRVSVCRGDG